MFGDYVYIGTLDARLVALKKDTGEVAWDTPVVDWRQGYSITGAPLALKDMVLTGVAGGEFGIRGFVKAFDAKTGKLRWTAYTIPGPGEPGNDTWPGDTWKNGGAPDLGHWLVRSRFEPRLLEHRQRRAVELPRAQGRQQMGGIDRRHERRHRQNRLGLSVHAVGLLGLRRGEHAAAGGCRPRVARGA